MGCQKCDKSLRNQIPRSLLPSNLLSSYLNLRHSAVAARGSKERKAKTTPIFEQVAAGLRQKSREKRTYSDATYAKPGPDWKSTQDRTSPAFSDQNPVNRLYSLLTGCTAC